MKKQTIEYLEKTYNNLLERYFLNIKGSVFQFVGIVNNDDGFYYELLDISTKKKELHCCLGSLKDAGFTLTYNINDLSK
jgi:hypothetical protein